MPGIKFRVDLRGYKARDLVRAAGDGEIKAWSPNAETRCLLWYKRQVVEADHSKGLASSYLRLVRPKQWTKNGFVLAGVVFAEKAFSTTQVAYALLAFAVFCALSGAVYAANDVLDVEEDRKHPLKRFRPVASGAVSPRSALAFAAVPGEAALAVGFLVLPVGVGIAGIAYLVLQVFYTTISSTPRSWT
jgi:4-hydroxybenzoate polyprenyltransferase